MMKMIIAYLGIIGLCANVSSATGMAPTTTSQASAFSSSVLNSTVTQILKGTNSTDSAIWDSSNAAGTGGIPAATSAGVYSSATWFGPGATNDTSYLWGYPSASAGSTATSGTTASGTSGFVYTQSAIRKRTINNTIVGWGNDTSEACVVVDTSVSTAIMGGDRSTAVAPGYLALLTSGYDSAATPNYQVWITIVSSSSSSIKVTSTADVIANAGSGTSGVPQVGVSCTSTTFGLGNIWYDMGAGAFFYCYWKNVATTSVATAIGTCGSASSPTSVTTIYLGGMYVNGSAYWTSPISVSATLATAGSGYVQGLLGGADNSTSGTSSSNIWIIYYDGSDTLGVTYASKTTKSANTSAITAFSALQKNTVTGSPGDSATVINMYYYPTAVWSSGVTYGITLTNQTKTTTYSAGGVANTPTSWYGWTNYFNGTSTAVDSGLATSSSTNGVAYFRAWQLNTGYTIVAGIESATSTVTYTLATYFANGTANSTAMTAGTLPVMIGPQFYEDANGTQWIGWIDVDTANSDEWTYDAYLAKFQGQLNAPSSANIISVLSIGAVFLASIFII